MPTNPFTDAWQFLTAATHDYLQQGNWRYLTPALFWALLLAGTAVAVQNWRGDPAQRTGRHFGMWLVRMLIGCMWFQGMLWKLPLPVSDGLQYWTEQESTSAAFEFHRNFLKDVVLPHMSLFGPIVFLAELVFAGSMLLGLAVRFGERAGHRLHAATLARTLRNSSEWPWTYMFLALLMFLFAVEGAGRSLGMDAWLRRKVPGVLDGKGFVGWFFNIAG
jgi:hypothetical protein